MECRFLVASYWTQRTSSCLVYIHPSSTSYKSKMMGPSSLSYCFARLVQVPCTNKPKLLMLHFQCFCYCYTIHNFGIIIFACLCCESLTQTCIKYSGFTILVRLYHLETLLFLPVIFIKIQSYSLLCSMKIMQ